MAMPDYQYITYKNVDGVAVVNFMETVSMFDTDKVKDVGSELMDLVDSKKYTKLRLESLQCPIRLERDAGPSGQAASQGSRSERHGSGSAAFVPVIMDAFKVSNFGEREGPPPAAWQAGARSTRPN